MHVVNVADCDAGFIPPAPAPRPRHAPNFIWLRSAAALPTLLSNPIAAFSEDAYSEPITFSYIFNQLLAIVHDPDMLRHIFIDRADALIADPVRQAVLKPALREGMLTAEGDKWRNARRAISPIFAPRHVNGFASTMRITTEQYIETLASGPRDVRIADHMTKLTYRVLSQTLFSGDIDESGEQMLADVAYFLKHLSQPDPLDFLGAPEWLPRLTKLRGSGALKRLRETVRETAQTRKVRINTGKNVPEDFLTLLLKTKDSNGTGLTLDEVEDNIITFIAAGHETTARALAWTLYLLAFDPSARERCETEADDLDIDGQSPSEWSNELPWLTACFEESMRLFPPAAIIARRLIDDVNFNGTHIAAGANLITSPWVLHRHKCLWNRPMEYHPERFFGENRKQINRFAYLPFGLGARVCIGASFAMQEALIIMALLLRRFRFEYSGDAKPWPVMKITVQPDNGVPMRIMPR